ncbi:MAG: hypothetical protein Kapaf2KO_21050 [Candidatus Kapaibacteriales bacterium]
MGDKLVIAGIANELDSNRRLAIAYGDPKTKMDTVFYPEIQMRALGNLRVDPTNGDLIVIGFDFTNMLAHITYVVRINSDMEIVKYVTNEENFVSHFTDLAILPSGTIYTIGMRNNDAGGNNDIMLTIFESDLSVRSRSFIGVAGRTDLGKSFVLHSNGNLYFSADVYSEFSETNCPSVYHIDTLGNVVWKTELDDPRSVDGCQEIYEDTDGNLLVVGENPMPNFLFDFVLAKLTPDGEILFLDYRGWDDTHDAGFNIRPIEGGYLASGYSDEFSNGINKRGLCMKLDKGFNIIDTIIYPDDEAYITDMIEYEGEWFITGFKINAEDDLPVLWNITDFATTNSVDGVNPPSFHTKKTSINAKYWGTFLSNLSLDKSQRDALLYDMNGAILGEGWEDIISFNPKYGNYIIRYNDGSTHFLNVFGN